MTAANALGQIALRGARRSRLLRAGYTATQTIVRAFGRVLHLLFLQVAGLFFCFFALGLAAHIPRAVHDQVAAHQGPARVYLLGGLSLLFAWFGMSSFWRTRQK